jgi:hypothetical protein
MFLSPIRNPTAILCLLIPAAACFAAVLAIAEPTSTVIRIDSVEDKYKVQDFSFEVNNETGRAGIRLQYVYPPSLVGEVDSYWTPRPKMVTLPNLTYDGGAHAVVYHDGVKITTCAKAAGQRVLLWKIAIMKPTGACVVSSHLTAHDQDNGWGIVHLRTMDTYLEIQR